MCMIQAKNLKNAFVKYKAAKIKIKKNLPSQEIFKESIDYTSFDIKCGCLSGKISISKKRN